MTSTASGIRDEDEFREAEVALLLIVWVGCDGTGRHGRCKLAMLLGSEESGRGMSVQKITTLCVCDMLLERCDRWA